MKMEILEKINFRQTRYMLPAILYIPLPGGPYFIFDLFHTETAEIPDKMLQTTEFLNPELPEAQIGDDGIGSKYENMVKSWGEIRDYSSVDNIERDKPDGNEEEYESQYMQDDIVRFYGTDGMEGLYVPNSQFRETSIAEPAVGHRPSLRRGIRQRGERRAPGGGRPCRRMS